MFCRYGLDYTAFQRYQADRGEIARLVRRSPELVRGRGAWRGARERQLRRAAVVALLGRGQRSSWVKAGRGC